MSIFSEAALKHRNDRQTPDVISNIASPWMWILLIGLTIFAVAVIYWLFFGTLLDSVPGTGVVIRSGGVRLISAGSSGRLEYLDIQPGSPVIPNQIVGRIYNSDTFFNIRNLQVEQAELQERIKKIRAGMDRLADQRKNADDEKNKIIDNLVEQLRQSRKRMSELVAMQETLLKSGATSKAAYYNMLNQNVTNENSVSNTLIQQIESLYSQRSSRWDQEMNHIKLQGELYSKHLELELALRKNEDSILLRSHSAGTVVELLKREDDPVNAGDPIAVVSAANGNRNLTLVAYVSTEDGKKIRPGMSVFFSPASLRAAEYGYLKGIVLSSSMFPVSGESIHAELKNSDYAKNLTTGGAVMRVEVEFLCDGKTRSGLQWTSKNGAEATINPGMVGTLLINTEYRTPVSYIIPYFREHFLGIGKERNAGK